jgi:hypothetical protein
VFVDAIHTPDYLYYLTAKGRELPLTGGNTYVDKDDPSITPWRTEYPDLYRKNAAGHFYLDINNLVKYARNLNAKTDAELAANAKALIDTVNIGRNNNHNKSVFSFRVVERGATPGYEDFLIESMGSKADFSDRIAPCAGSWVRIYTGVPALSEQSNTIQEILQGSAIFNLTTSRNGLSNESVKVLPAAHVVSEVGGVTILGSSGKRVVLSNILGQPLVTKVLTSDAESISLPKGIVLVSVDGSSVTKAIVK